MKAGIIEMNPYKPEFLGKVMPVDNQVKMTEFVTNKFDAFNKVYDSCKDQSSNINDVKSVESSDSNSLSVKISADQETINNVAEKVKDDESVTVKDDVITAKV